MTTTTVARTVDPITSKMAGKQIVNVDKNVNAMRLLAQFSRRSMTAEQAGYEADLQYTGYWKRVSDLKNAGYITVRKNAKGEDMKWENRSGRMALVFKITEAGRAALRTFRAQKA